jgi:hypothetical protein
MLANGELRIDKNDLRVVFITVSKNWILLSLFAYGQSSEGVELLKALHGSPRLPKP